MIKFNTRYSRPAQVRSKMDQRDNVDRLSYVDSTKMVQRMILEGQNLNTYRAACQRAGMYKLEDLEKDENVPAMPVYQEDPVIMAAVRQSYESELKDSVESRQAEQEITPAPVEESKVDTPSVGE